MRIERKGILIRNAEKADATLLAAWWNDGRVMAHAGFPLGLGTNEERVAEQIARDSDEKGRHLILVYENKPIGEMNYRSADGRTAEIGIKICEAAYQEKGIGRIALSMLIGALFDAGFQKVILDTNLLNARAQHVYEKLGFRKTGVRINAWQDQLGKWQSAVDYELTRERFRDFS